MAAIMTSQKHSLAKKFGKKALPYLIAGIVAASSFLACNKDSASPNDTATQPTPKVTQTAVLQNDIDIRYTAKLENILKAQRKIFRNNQFVKSDSISGPNYTEILQDNLKGNYMFVSMGDTARTTVPNYTPEANVSPPVGMFPEVELLPNLIRDNFGGEYIGNW